MYLHNFCHSAHVKAKQILTYKQFQHNISGQKNNNKKKAYGQN